MSRFIAFLLTCVATGLVLSVSDDVKDIEAPDSPRAFYYAKNLDVVPLKSIQVVLFCFEILLGVLVVVKAVNRPLAVTCVPGWADSSIETFIAAL